MVSGSLIEEPALDPTGPSPDVFAVVDARLDNRAELARILACADDDEAVVAHAYRRWGPDCVHHLHGDFAFAVWEDARRSLFLARDRFGVRPLVYWAGEGRFAFASEVKGLRTLPEVAATSSELRIAEFLVGQVPPPGATMFDAIAKLPAAHCLRVDSVGVELIRYWDWRLPTPVPAMPSQARRLADLFDQAVSRRVCESVGVAVTLSGGLDSSSIAATVGRLPRFASEPVGTYSIVFDDGPGSERPFIDSLVRTGNFDPHILEPGYEDPFADFQRLIDVEDGLFLAPTLAMAPTLLRHLPPGTVVLDGHGGDEVISHGYERLHDLAKAGRWATFLREAIGASRVRAESWPIMVLSFYRAYGRGGWRLGPLHRRLTRGTGERPAALASVRLQEATIGRLTTAQDPPPSDGREAHMRMLAHPMQQYALEILDRKAVSSGLETRFPFWDEDLIRFMLAVDPASKLRGGWSRWIMREAMSDRLPADVGWRRDKHDFAHHLAAGLLRSPAASESRFARQEERLAPFLNLSAVQAARARLKTSGRRPAGSDIQALWRATAVAEWLDYADAHRIRITPC